MLPQGSTIKRIPLKERPTAMFRHKDGRIVRLPADTYSLAYYLKKGLVLVDENAGEEPKAINEPAPVEKESKPPKKRGRPRKSKKRRKA
jgi:hypothetical protein